MRAPVVGLCRRRESSREIESARNAQRAAESVGLPPTHRATATSQAQQIRAAPGRARSRTPSPTGNGVAPPVRVYRRRSYHAIRSSRTLLTHTLARPTAPILSRACASAASSRRELVRSGAESLQQACGRAIQSDAQEEPADTARIHMRQEIDRFFALFCARSRGRAAGHHQRRGAPGTRGSPRPAAGGAAGRARATDSAARERARELVEEQHEHEGESVREVRLIRVMYGGCTLTPSPLPWYVYWEILPPEPRALRTLAPSCSDVHPSRRRCGDNPRAVTTQLGHLLRCKYVLDHSRQPYAQLVAANALKQLLLQSWNQMPPQQRIDFRNYTLSFLANRGVECEQFVTQSLVQLIARITKMGWFESDEHRNILDEVSKFLHATPTHLLIGLRLFSQLVAEMNATTNTRSLTQHRKVTGAFRDGPLFQVVTLALRTLTQVHSGATSAGELMPRVTEAALQVVLACLSYDFIGTTLDEASEEMGTIQVPSSWRAAMQQPQTTQLFFDLHLRSSPPISSLSLEALVQLASLRRSLFSSDEERQSLPLPHDARRPLAAAGATRPVGACELPRALPTARSAQGELPALRARAGGLLAEWLDAVAKFTIESFFHWQWATNSVHYLLSLWSRLVASMPYLKGDAPSRLEEYVPQVIRAFISSRMELVRALLVSDDSAELDDPLDDEEQLSEQLETVPSLCRFQLESLSTYVLTLFEPCAALYQQLLARPAAERTSRGCGCGWHSPRASSRGSFT